VLPGLASRARRGCAIKHRLSTFTSGSYPERHWRANHAGAVIRGSVDPAHHHVRGAEREEWRSMANSASVRWTCILAASIAITACSEDGARGTRSTSTDSAGIPIVFTQIGQNATECRVSEEVVRIGSVDDVDGSALFGVNGAVILADDRIAIVNRGTSQIKVFSRAGDFESEFGRQGEGPDEFKNLWSIHLRGEDTLVVGDYRPWRFTFFTPTGELVRRVALQPPEIERPDFASPLSAGSGFMMEEPSFEIQEEMVDRIVPLHLHGEDGESQGMLGMFWLDEYGYLSKEIRYVGRPVFGARASFAALNDSLILYGTGRHEQLEVWSRTGALRRIIRWRARERAVASGDADVWRRERRREIESRGEITPEMRPIIEAQIGEHLPVSDQYPGHDQVVVSHTGSIWVKQYRRPLDEGPDRWWVFTRTGEFVCAATLPEDYRVLAVRDGRLLAVTRDSLDVEFIVGHDVQYVR
jgi:hypothetical protein